MSFSTKIKEGEFPALLQPTILEEELKYRLPNTELLAGRIPRNSRGNLGPDQKGQRRGALTKH